MTSSNNLNLETIGQTNHLWTNKQTYTHAHTCTCKNIHTQIGTGFDRLFKDIGPVVLIFASSGFFLLIFGCYKQWKHGGKTCCSASLSNKVFFGWIIESALELCRKTVVQIRCWKSFPVTHTACSDWGWCCCWEQSRTKKPKNWMTSTDDIWFRDRQANQSLMNWKANSHARTHACTHAWEHTHTRTRTRTHPYGQTHTRTHTHAHTHNHT